MAIFEILNFQGNAATCLRCGGKYYMDVVRDLVLFTAVKKFANRLRFDKVISYSTTALIHPVDLVMYLESTTHRISFVPNLLTLV